MKGKQIIKIRPAKRAFDILVSSLSLAILSPFFCLIAFLMKIEGLRDPSLRGPVFFKEIRISKGRHFEMYKFRTVKSPILKLLKKEDRSITEFTSFGDKHKYLTPVGAFLARRYLDELPQLFNVIKGQMSLVGPRPHVPEHYKRDLKVGIISAKYIETGLMGLVQASKGNPALREAFARMAKKHYTKNKKLAIIDRLYFQKYMRVPAIELLFYDIWIIFRCIVVVIEAKGF